MPDLYINCNDINFKSTTILILNILATYIPYIHKITYTIPTITVKYVKLSWNIHKCQYWFKFWELWKTINKMFGIYLGHIGTTKMRFWYLTDYFGSIIDQVNFVCVFMFLVIPKIEKNVDYHQSIQSRSNMNT